MTATVTPARTLRPKGLRASATVSFAAGALGLSVILALGTYLSARHYLIEARERAAMRQAFSDASYVRDTLLTAGGNVNDALGTISPPSGSVVLVYRDGDWYSSSLQVSASDIPPSVQNDVAAGSASIAWMESTDAPATIVAIPLPAVDAVYYEVAFAREFDRTLATLRWALLACAGITTLGGALLGRAASRRLLAPLGEVTSAASRISDGQLHTRLESSDDPDLATLVESFNTMVDALDERIQRDTRFAADVSHELRSPMTTLKASVNVLQNAEDLPPRSRQALDLISTELDRFHRSLEDLLTLGRLDSGVSETAPTVVDLESLVRHALSESGRADIVVEVRNEVGEPMLVRVDKQQLNRALVNLFDNADMHGDGLTLVTVVRDGELADVYVDDEGPGVEPADRERIFERFARAGARRSRPGTGLGLSIVSQTYRIHRGSVHYVDRGEPGARFVARLPLTVREDAE